MYAVLLVVSVATHFSQDPFQLQRHLFRLLSGSYCKPSYLNEQTRLKRRDVTTLVGSSGGFVFLRDDNLETGMTLCCVINRLVSKDDRRARSYDFLGLG